MAIILWMGAVWPSHGAHDASCLPISVQKGTFAGESSCPASFSDPVFLREEAFKSLELQEGGNISSMAIMASRPPQFEACELLGIPLRDQ